LHVDNNVINVSNFQHYCATSSRSFGGSQHFVSE